MKLKLFFLLIQLLLVFFLSTEASNARSPLTSNAYINNAQSQTPLYYLGSKTSPNNLYKLEAFSGDYNVEL
ncbi:hypothetical protein CO058_03605 [candidate division WWE3 bacterium CG_4_9_14_0_2_um_filter_35_11]|uniref:Uncharacterized protein n=1 Tax=candidate division WWE3 bacterium CG_4_9_14_0_2_um_filter_35_11 TaxID=1975077 RepID=A0A2M8EKX9_UNCKA|nr:MAG: hypothetical protein CO058_03605 [candidate division WWE3 bacterium CG_4_9_14_0_2_um_filter_35_11]